MEFWLGLPTNLVGCREDDGRRKEKKGGDEKHMIGEGRRGERSRRIKGAQRERELRTDEDKAEGKLLGTHSCSVVVKKIE